MAKAPKITIDELEAKYPLYCKALKLLVKDARGVDEIKRSLCWDRLALLQRTVAARHAALGTPGENDAVAAVGASPAAVGSVTYRAWCERASPRPLLASAVCSVATDFTVSRSTESTAHALIHMASHRALTFAWSTASLPKASRPSRA